MIFHFGALTSRTHYAIAKIRSAYLQLWNHHISANHIPIHFTRTGEKVSTPFRSDNSGFYAFSKRQSYLNQNKDAVSTSLTASLIFI